jgi:predicted kinase
LEALFFDVPLTICLERNRGRGRVVPEEAILTMARTMEPPTRAEGFARVTRIGG